MSKWITDARKIKAYQNLFPLPNDVRIVSHHITKVLAIMTSAPSGDTIPNRISLLSLVQSGPV